MKRIATCEQIVNCFAPNQLAYMISDSMNVSKEVGAQLMIYLQNNVGREEAYKMVANARKYESQISRLINENCEESHDPEIVLERKWIAIIHSAQDRYAILDREHDELCERLKESYNFDDAIRSLEWELDCAERDRVLFQMDVILIKAQLEWVSFIREMFPNAQIRWVGMNCIVNYQEYFAKAM